MPPRGPVLTVIITSVTDGLEKGLTVAEGKIGGLAKAGGKIAKVAKVAAPIAGVAAVTAKLGAAGDKAATAMQSFDAAMAAAGASSADLAGPLKDAQKQATAMAFSGGDARDSLVALQTATGDAAKSAELLAVAQDVARLSGADLTVASDAVAKAYAGQDRQLRALIPGMAATESGMETIALAEKAAAGQSEIFADSAEGMGIRTKAALKGIAITVGKAVAPAFRTMLAALLPVVEALGELITAILPILIPLINAIAKGFEIAAKAIAKVVQWVTKLISKIKELLKPLNDAIAKLDKLNPFSRQSGMGNIIGGNSAAAVAGLTNARVATTGTGNATINIYGDPAVIEAKVIRALRGYQARNGVGAVLTPGRM